MAAPPSSPSAALSERGCRVPGCPLDLSMGYSTKYRICESHYRVASMELEGATVRFCQQCGKFHGLEDFEDDRRSCRISLQRHKARRRRAEARRHQEQASKAQHKGRKDGKEAGAKEEVAQQGKGQEKKQKQEPVKEEAKKQEQSRQEGQGQKQQAALVHKAAPNKAAPNKPVPASTTKLILKRPAEKQGSTKPAPQPRKRAAQAEPKHPSNAASKALERPGGPPAKEQAQQRSQKRRRLVLAPPANSYSDSEGEEEGVVPQVGRLAEPALSGPSGAFSVPSKPPASLQQQLSVSSRTLGSTAGGRLHSLPASPRGGPAVPAADLSGLLPDEGELLSWQLDQLRPQQHLVQEALNMLVGSTDTEFEMDVPSTAELLEISQDLGILRDAALPTWRPQKHAVGGSTPLGMLGHAGHAGSAPVAPAPVAANGSPAPCMWQQAQAQMRSDTTGAGVALGVPLTFSGWAADLHANNSNNNSNYGLAFTHGFDISAPMAAPDFSTLLSLPIAPPQAQPHAGDATAHSLAYLQRAPLFAAPSNGVSAPAVPAVQAASPAPASSFAPAPSACEPAFGGSHFAQPGAWEAGGTSWQLLDPFPSSMSLASTFQGR